MSQSQKERAYGKNSTIDTVVMFCCQKLVVFFMQVSLVSSPLDCDQNRTTAECVCTYLLSATGRITKLFLYE